MDSPITSLTIGELRQKQVDLEQEERYIEAEEVVRRIEYLIKSTTDHQAKDLRSKHTSDFQSLEERYEEEKKEFLGLEEEKLASLKSDHLQQSEKLRQKQKERFLAERKLLDSTVNIIFKPSSHLLELEKSKEKAVRTKHYIEADALKKAIAELKACEERAYSADKQEKIKKMLTHLEGLFSKEQERLERKQLEQIHEFAIRKKVQLEKIEKKYANQRNDLANAQRIEMNIAYGKQTSGLGRRTSLSPTKTKLTTSRSLDPRKKQFN